MSSPATRLLGIFLAVLLLILAALLVVFFVLGCSGSRPTATRSLTCHDYPISAPIASTCEAIE